jgi:hypothetical protein
VDVLESLIDTVPMLAEDCREGTVCLTCFIGEITGATRTAVINAVYCEGAEAAIPFVERAANVASAAP